MSDEEDKILKKIVNSLRINWPATSEDIEKVRKRLKREHVKHWSELRSQGYRVKDFSREKIGNVWLKEYNLLKLSKVIDTLRLRTNTFGTNTVLTRDELIKPNLNFTLLPRSV